MRIYSTDLVGFLTDRAKFFSNETPVQMDVADAYVLNVKFLIDLTEMAGTKEPI